MNTRRNAKSLESAGMGANGQEWLKWGDCGDGNGDGKRGGRPRVGSLYRRDPAGASHPVDSDPSFPIWLRYQLNGRRVHRNLETADVDVARIRQAEIMSAAPGRSRDRVAYLQNLVRLGTWAAAELAQARPVVLIESGWKAFEGSRRRRNPGARTMQEYKTRWKQFEAWAKASGIKSVDEVNPSQSEFYTRHLECPRSVAGRHVDLSASSVNTHLSFLRMFWGVVLPDRPNPWVGVRSAKSAARKVVYRRLTVEEVAKVVAAADGEYRLLVVVGYTTGLRLVDAALLDWSCVDLEGGTIKVVPRKTAGRKAHRAGGGAVEPPILPDLRRLLEAVEDRQGPVMPAVAAAYASGTLGAHLAALWEAAGVVASAAGHASFRSLRVTWQSLNDEAGTSRVIARAVLGHVSPEMSDTYSRLDTSIAAAAVTGAIPSVLAKSA